MTILYVVGKVTEELRYSLRSVHAHMAHDAVALVGSPVRWLRGVNHMSYADRHRSRARNVTEKVMVACRSLDDPDIVVMWDDTFILDPWEARGLYYRDTISHQIIHIRGMGYGPTNAYRKALEATMQRFGRDAKFCGTHHPHLFDREKLIATCEEVLASPEPFELATAYGAMHGGDFIKVANAKPREWKVPQGAVFSSADQFERNPAYIAWRDAAFPEACPYEV